MKLPNGPHRKTAFLLLYLFFAAITVLLALLTITDRIKHAGYAVPTMVVTLFFHRLYQDSKHSDEDDNP